MALDYELIEANSKYKFIVAGLNGSGKTTVSGIMMNEVSMGFSNQFQTAREALDELLSSLPLGKAIGGLVSTIRAGADIARQVSAVSGRSKLTVAETRKVWNGSGLPQFTVDFFFYATSVDQKDRPMERIKRLQRAVMPSGTKASGGKIFQRAPLGYKVDGSGTMMLTIGNWFVAPGLVMDSMNFTPSRESMSDGSPLYISGSFTLVPYKAISYEEFQSYYRI